jgi:hypothetical protein
MAGEVRGQGSRGNGPQLGQDLRVTMPALAKFPDCLLNICFSKTTIFLLSCDQAAAQVPHGLLPSASRGANEGCSRAEKGRPLHPACVKLVYLPIFFDCSCLVPFLQGKFRLGISKGVLGLVNVRRLRGLYPRVLSAVLSTGCQCALCLYLLNQRSTAHFGLVYCCSPKRECCWSVSRRWLSKVVPLHLKRSLAWGKRALSCASQQCSPSIPGAKRAWRQIDLGKSDPSSTQ